MKTDKLDQNEMRDFRPSEDTRKKVERGVAAREKYLRSTNEMRTLIQNIKELFLYINKGKKQSTQ